MAGEQDKVVDPGGPQPADAPIGGGPQPADAPIGGGPQPADHDWKVQARLEKEQLAEEAAAASDELPPASLPGLVEELSLRALFALGQVPDPRSGESYVHLEGASYLIDMLSVLEEKTKGNLDAEEKAYLAEVLQKIRLVFARVAEEIRSGAIVPAEEPPGGDLGGTHPDADESGPRIIV